MSETRIHWGEDERELVIEAMAECYRAKPNARFEPVWVAGQAILAPDRRRKWYSSFSGPNSVTGRLFAEAKRRATAKVEPVRTEEERQPEVTFVPVPTPTPLSEVPLKELLAECIGRILALTLTPNTVPRWVTNPIEQAAKEQAVEQMLQHARTQERVPPSAFVGLPSMEAPARDLQRRLALVDQQTNELMRNAPTQERTRPVRIGVCGLLPDQFRRVKEQINGKKVELVLVSNQYNPSKEDWKQSMDYAVISRFVRHGHHEQAKQALGHERVRWVSSGTESVVAMVSELVPGSVN